MLHLRAAFWVALFSFIQSVPTLAQDVTLTSQDGAVEISGTLLGFDGEFYRVDTEYGELTLDGTGVNCQGPGCPNLIDFVAEIDISGSAKMGSVLLPALVESYAIRRGLLAERVTVDTTHFYYVVKDRNTEKLLAKFFFRISNTDEGFADLLANEADIIMSLREVSKSESRRAREIGMGDLTSAGRNRVLSLDAMVPVVSAGNPITKITTPDLADVLSGEIINWAAFGGPDAPITVHMRDAKAGLAQAAIARLLTSQGKRLTVNAMRYDNDAALIDAVESDPFGIGITSRASIGNLKTLALTGKCGFSLTATRRTVKTEDYPLTAPMFLYIPMRRLPQIGRDFLAYTRSEAAQYVIRRAGFIDQAPEEISVNEQGDRFANAVQLAGIDTPLTELQRMTAVLKPMKRLSTTFRFERGSTKLDAQSRSNVQQLSKAIEAGLYDNRSLVFIGFSDGEGPAGPNREIALRRAEVVRRAIQSTAQTAKWERLKIDVDSFGEAMPMACDDSRWGRQVNRRVEVWIK